MEETYLFSFLHFVNKMREYPDKKNIIEEYENYYGPMPADFRETDIYKKYVSKFTLPEGFRLITPDELALDFDWELLEQLIAASLSSDYWYELSEDTTSYQLNVSVAHNGVKVVKKIKELWAFQILKLYKIYIEEQIKLFTLMAEDDEEYEAIAAEQKTRIKKYNLKTSGLKNSNDFFNELNQKLETIAN